MPRRFWIALALLALCLVLSGASLFSVRWISRSGATCIALGQGTAWGWIGRPGDFPRPASAVAGWVVGGWSGDALLWKPELERAQKVWVARPGARAAVQIVGLSVRVPMYLPLLAMLACTGLLWQANRRSVRRARRGQCPGCGYDLAGSPRRCPECGREAEPGPIRALLRRLGLGARHGPLVPLAH
jgi:hypothetical protein